MKHLIIQLVILSFLLGFILYSCENDKYESLLESGQIDSVEYRSLVNGDSLLVKLDSLKIKGLSE